MNVDCQPFKGAFSTYDKPMKNKQATTHTKAPTWASNVAVGVMSLCLAASGGLLTLSVLTYKELQAKSMESIPTAVFLNRAKQCGEPIHLTNDRTNLFLINGLLNGHPVRFLFDTGASNTIIPSHLAESLLTTANREQAKTEKVETLGGEIMATKIAGQTIDIGGNSFLADVLVVPSFSNELILGMDIIPLFSTTIDSSGLRLVIPC